MTAAEVFVARGAAATRVQRHARGWLARRRCRTPLKQLGVGFLKPEPKPGSSSALSWAAVLRSDMASVAWTPARQSRSSRLPLKAPSAWTGHAVPI